MEYMYYGRHDGIKPKREIGLTMIDEAVRKILEKQENLFRQECNRLLISLKNENKQEMQVMRNQISTLKEVMKRCLGKDQVDNEFSKAQESVKERVKKEKRKEKINAM